MNIKQKLRRKSTRKEYRHIFESCFVKKRLWPTLWFWSKTIWRNNKVTTRQGEDCTTGYLLDYDYFKNHRLLAVHIARQEDLYGYTKVVQQMGVVGRLKITDGVNANYV